MKRDLRLALSAVLLAVMVGSACTSSPAINDNALREVEFSALTDMMARNAKKKGLTILVDVRQAPEYDAGHIPGAINIPLGELAKITSGDPRLASAKHIVVYSKSWHRSVAPVGAKMLMREGYANVHVYRRGIEEWQLKDRPVSTTPK